MDCPATFSPPGAYAIGYSFANFQAYNPAKPLPGQSLDDELASIQSAIGELICALRRIQRDDGALVNGLVTFDALSADVVSRFGLPTPLVAVNVAQFKHALALVGQVGNVTNAISADQNDLANIQWTSGGVVAPGDVLASLVQATLGYSALQMTALFARAARLTTLLPAFGDVTVTQVKRALAVSGQVAAVDARVPADPNSLINVQWTSGGTTGVGDPLAVFIEAQLNLGIAGITSLYQLAAQQSP